MLLGAGTVEERLLRLGFEKRWIERRRWQVLAGATSWGPSHVHPSSRRAAGEAFRLALFPAPWPSSSPSFSCSPNPLKTLGADSAETD